MQRDHDVPGEPDDRGRAARRHYQRGPHLFRRGEWWYIRIPGAAPPERALRTRDGAEASRLFREYLDGRRGAEALAPGATADEMPLAEIARRWVSAPHGWTRRTAGSYEARAAAFVTAMQGLGVRLPSQLSADKLDAWQTARGGDVARATINRDLTVARRMLAWAAHEDRRYCAPTPLARRKNLREPKRRPRRTIPDPRQVAAVVRALGRLGEDGVALTVAAAAATGLRLEELRRLQPEHLTHGVVRVEPEGGPADAAWETKGYATREIPLAPAALDVVRRFVAWRSTAKGGKGKAVGLADTWLAERLDAACAAAKVPVFRMHDLRRGFVTEAVNAGISIRVVSKWLGHKDVATTEGYVGTYGADAKVRPPAPAAIRSATKPRGPAGTRESRARQSKRRKPR